MCITEARDVKLRKKQIELMIVMCNDVYYRRM